MGNAYINWRFKIEFEFRSFFDKLSRVLLVNISKSNCDNLSNL